MRHFHLKKNPSFCPTVNVDSLWSLVDAKTKESVENGTSPKGQALVIDCLKLGYHKVLGNGRLPKIPLVVKAKYFSARAERKIKSVGGVCIPIA